MPDGSQQVFEVRHMLTEASLLHLASAKSERASYRDLAVVLQFKLGHSVQYVKAFINNMYGLPMSMVGPQSLCAQRTL